MRFMVLMVLVAVVLFVADLLYGSVAIPAGEVLGALLGAGTNDTWEKIILLIRLPKALTAILVGAALSVSGLQMQTLFRNPLAGPSVLGITAGASLGVALVMFSSGSATGIYLIQQLGFAGSWAMAFAATAGAALVMVVVLLISVRLRDNVALLIIGIMIGNLAIAFISIWQYFSRPEQIQDYLLWTFGSLGGVTREQLWVVGPVVVAGIVASFTLSKSLNMLLLGENYAYSMGMNIRLARFAIIACVSMLAGTITGFAGPIAFVGIAVPHLCRSLINTSDHRRLIPACLATGAALMLGCDLLSQWPGRSFTLPINAITTLIGSPVVVAVILKQRNLRKSF
jgi:iron complex transport system permease protein